MTKRNILFALAIAGFTFGTIACGGGESSESTNEVAVEETPVTEEVVADPAVWTAPEEAKAVTNPIAMSAASSEKGKALFTQFCVSCHGESGMGDAPAGKAVNAANLMEKVPTQTDGEIHWKLLNGKGAMLKISTYGISDEDGWHLINYLRDLTKQG
jgi:mono/diheme cytochrome c family protein